MIIRKEEKLLLLWMVQSVSCKLPLVPKATYTILGFNVLIYLLQMASMAILNEDDLLLMLGTCVTDLIRSSQ